jgi:hypothetical protein
MRIGDFAGEQCLAMRFVGSTKTTGKPPAAKGGTAR